MYFDKNQDTWIIEFSPEYEKENEEIIDEMIQRVFGSKGSIERLEQLFDIEFAAGIENGVSVFLSKLDWNDPNEDVILKKYDGKTCFATPPRDNQTDAPFKKNKLTFKIKEREQKDHSCDVTGLINSKIRNTINLH